MLKILNAESKSIVSGAAVVGILSLVSRLVGLVRDRLLAGMFGAGDVLDVYYAAFRLPDLLFNLIVVGALSASFIPLFSKHYAEGKKSERAWDLTTNVLHVILLGMLVLSAALFFAADPLSALIAPGFSPEKRHAVAGFTRVMLSAQVLLAASMVFGSTLQGMKRFFLSSFAPVFYNVGIIVGGLWFTRFLGPIGLAWGVVLGAFLHLMVQFVGARAAGYRHRWIFEPKDPDAREVVRLMGPRAAGIGLSQLVFVAYTTFATTLAAGSVTLFQFAYNIQFFPVGIVGVSYAIAAFPTFAETLGKKDHDGFRAAFSSTVRQVLFFLTPLSVAFLLLRAQAVRIVVGAGAFDWSSTVATADALAAFVLSVGAQSLVYVLARAYYALRDTYTPLVLGLAGDAIGLLIAFWLAPKYGVAGLGLAFSLGIFIELVLMWVILRQRLGTLGESTMVRSVLTVSGAGLVAAVVIQLGKQLVPVAVPLTTFWSVFAQGAVAGGLGLLAYLGVCALAGSEELGTVAASLKRKLFRRYQPTEATPPDTTATGA